MVFDVGYCPGDEMILNILFGDLRFINVGYVFRHEQKFNIVAERRLLVVKRYRYW